MTTTTNMKMVKMLITIMTGGMVVKDLPGETVPLIIMKMKTKTKTTTMMISIIEITCGI